MTIEILCNLVYGQVDHFCYSTQAGSAAYSSTPHDVLSTLALVKNLKVFIGLKVSAN